MPRPRSKARLRRTAPGRPTRAADLVAAALSPANPRNFRVERLPSFEDDLSGCCPLADEGTCLVEFVARSSSDNWIPAANAKYTYTMSYQGKYLIALTCRLPLFDGGAQLPLVFLTAVRRIDAPPPRPRSPLNDLGERILVPAGKGALKAALVLAAKHFLGLEHRPSLRAAKRVRGCSEFNVHDYSQGYLQMWSPYRVFDRKQGRAWGTDIDLSCASGQRVLPKAQRCVEFGLVRQITVVRPSFQATRGVSDISCPKIDTFGEKERPSAVSRRARKSEVTYSHGRGAPVDGCQVTNHLGSDVGILSWRIHLHCFD